MATFPASRELATLQVQPGVKVLEKEKVLTEMPGLALEAESEQLPSGEIIATMHRAR